MTQGWDCPQKGGICQKGLEVRTYLAQFLLLGFLGWDLCRPSWVQKVSSRRVNLTTPELTGPRGTRQAFLIVPAILKA